MALTDMQVRALRGGEKPKKYSDGEGLYLLVSKTGSKLWRLKYYYAGKEKLLALGAYPEITLRDARDSTIDARRLLAKGIDPGAEKRTRKAHLVTSHANTFEAIAREWYDSRKSKWGDDYAANVLGRLVSDVFPRIGPRPISEIKAPELLAVIRKIEARVIETAHRALRDCGAIFRYGIATGRCERDIAADLRGSLRAIENEHFAATTDPKRLGHILLLLDGYAPRTHAGRTLAAYLRLMPMFYSRPGELRHAERTEFDLDKALWEIPASRMKSGRPHIVACSTQAVAILREHFDSIGASRWAFPGGRSGRPISNAAPLVAMRRLGIGQHEMVVHGFRAVARTILDESLGFRPDFIEHQLSHIVRDPQGRAYNRTRFLEERRKMMQAWSDHLDKLKAEAAAE